VPPTLGAAALARPDGEAPQARALKTGEVALFKGCGWTGHAHDGGIVRRSPRLAGTGLTRIVLVLDAAWRTPRGPAHDHRDPRLRAPPLARTAARPAAPLALPDLLRQRIVLLDGAMGTMLQQWRLSEPQFRGDLLSAHPGTLKGNNELLHLTQPQVVRENHEAYLAAGSDIVETNTFGATAIAQADYGLAHLAREMNVQATALARQACDRCSTPGQPRFVAGAIGPTSHTVSISPDVNDPGARNVSFDERRAADREQVEWCWKAARTPCC
jgi:hypothetical protein